MSTSVTRRTEADRIKELLQRVSILERRIRALTEDEAGDAAKEILWSVDGALSVGSSNRYYFESAQDLRAFRITLGTTGSTATVVEVRRNGSAAETVTLAAAATTDRVEVSETYQEGDYYTVAITQAGSGAEDLQTQGIFEV